jgi:hypothetical protein
MGKALIPHHHKVLADIHLFLTARIVGHFLRVFSAIALIRLKRYSRGPGCIGNLKEAELIGKKWRPHHISTAKSSDESPVVTGDIRMSLFYDQREERLASFQTLSV